MKYNCFEKFIEKHIDKSWNWGQWGLSYNPSITPEFIEKHIDKDWWWGRGGLSGNSFTKEIQNERKQQIILEILQEKTKKMIYDDNINTIIINYI